MTADETEVYMCSSVLVIVVACTVTATVWLAFLVVNSDSDLPGVALTVARIIFCRGRHAPGEITGVVFPINPKDLEGKKGAKYLTAMLQHGKHLPKNVSVTAVHNEMAKIR